MVDPRIRSYLEAAHHLARGEFPVRVPVSGDDEVASLGQALDDLARRMERLYEEARLLAAVAQQVNKGLILEEVLDQVYASFRAVVPYDRIGFALVTHEGTTATAYWARSESARIRIPRGFQARLAGSSLREVLESGRPRILNDLPAYLEANPGSDSTRRIVEEGMRSSLTCPLVAMGKAVGFLFFSSMQAGSYRDVHVDTSMQAGSYRDVHVDTFMQLSGQLSMILEKSRLYEQILEEQARSERLLLAVLPEPIALRLKAGETQVADQADATVLFADIVGFSRLAARVAPATLVSFLDDVFGHLDRAAARRGVEKIKTIGDAWMGAAGVPRARADHARCAAEMALDAMDVASRHGRPDGEPLQLRLGLHSGPVVAGVIGRSRLVYDLWGDTVNVARRMEELGETGRIQVSATTRELLGSVFRFEDRGALPTKAGGDVTTSWLVGR